MPNDRQVAYQINLMIDAADGAGVYVRSRDVLGMHLVGKSLQAMKPTIETAIKRLFLDNRGVEVNVVWLEEVGSFKSEASKAKGGHVATDKLAVYPVLRAA